MNDCEKMESLNVIAISLQDIIKKTLGIQQLTLLKV
jgi:hypothetical protein